MIASHVASMNALLFAMRTSDGGSIKPRVSKIGLMFICKWNTFFGSAYFFFGFVCVGFTVKRI